MRAGKRTAARLRASSPARDAGRDRRLPPGVRRLLEPPSDAVMRPSGTITRYDPPTRSDYPAVQSGPFCQNAPSGSRGPPPRGVAAWRWRRLVERPRPRPSADLRPGPGRTPPPPITSTTLRRRPSGATEGQPDALGSQRKGARKPECVYSRKAEAPKRSHRPEPPGLSACRSSPVVKAQTVGREQGRKHSPHQPNFCIAPDCVHARLTAKR